MADDIAQWLEGIGLGQYAQAFADSRIDFDVLRQLTEDHLEDLGLPLGDRLRLLDAIAAHDGDPQAPAMPEPASPAAEAIAGSGERRRVAIVFVDLAGFTRLSTTADPEEVHGLLGKYFEAVDRIVLDHGGHIDKHIGDAVMGVFGAPISHGNDTERAVRAALAVHSALEEISHDVGREIRAHIGIATGEVVAGGTGSSDHREYTVTGSSVNLASRLVSVAQPGETLLSEAAWREVSQIADSTFHAEISVKGFDRPIRAWRVRTLGDGKTAPRRRRIVGRRVELAQFDAILEACQDACTGQLLIVRGEAGIGKTHLVEEFSRRARERGWLTHAVRIIDFGGGRDRDALSDLARSLLGVPLNATVRDRQTRVETMIAHDALEPAQVAALYDMFQVAHPPDIRPIYEAMDAAARNRCKRDLVSRLVERASAAAPVLIVIEDIHWADRPALEHLAEVVSVVSERPVVVAMTSRADGDPIDPAWRSRARATALNTIDLRPLRPIEAEQLAHNMGATDARIVTECIERAEGNPLFLEQLLNEASEGDRSELPGSIQSVILMRMDRLARTDKEALQAASVIGQRFGLDVLKHLLDAPAYDGTALIDHFLIRPDADGYAFVHALIRDGAYASLLKTRRRSLHRLAADWYAERDPVLTAEHLDRADDPEAPRAYLEAARSQVLSFQQERALRLAERGRVLARERGDVFALDCCRGEALNALGSIRDSIDAFELAAAIAATDVERCLAWLGQVAGMRLTDRTDDALALLDKAEGAATASDLALELSRIHHVRGNILFPIGDLDGCLGQHELALGFARQAASIEDEAQALSGLGDAYLQHGRMITAGIQYDRCARLAAEYNFAAIDAANLSQRAWTRLFQNDLQGALEFGKIGVEQAVKIGHQRAEVVGCFTVATMLHEMSKIAEAEKHLDRGFALAQQLGMRRFEVVLLYLRAWLCVDQARYEEGAELSRQAMDIFQQTGDFFAGARVWGIMAQLTKDDEERRHRLAEGEDLLEKRAHGINAFYFYRDAIEVCLKACAWSEAERYAALMEIYSGPEPLPWSEFFVARGRALTVHGSGNSDASTFAELERLRDEADRAQLNRAIPALDAAMIRHH